VQQLLGNLVGNAIKFTPRGGKVTVDAVRSGAEVQFSVADTGPGIPAEVSEHVFERYWRGRERDYTKGVGLGLFISKGIVDAHGGRIWLESVLGRGTTFYFTLPLAP
jgi:signal transduction histidine kinase